MTASRVLSAALHYASLGWPVLPLRPSEKTPLGGLVPHGLHDATTEPETIERWWWVCRNANVAIATGRVSGLLVVDVDGPEGARSWHALVAQHGWPRTLIQRTGSGGHQVVLERPVRDVVPNRARALPGIDVRGDGGYIVAPPSLHPCGELYRWIRHAPPAPCPDWLLGALYAERRAEASVRPRQTRQPGATTARLDALCQVVAGEATGRRNHALYWATACARECVEAGELSEADATDALTSAGLSCGLGDHEIAATIRSGLRGKAVR